MTGAEDRSGGDQGPDRAQDRGDRLPVAASAGSIRSGVAGLRSGQRYTFALGLLVAWFLLAVSLPHLYREPSAGAAASTPAAAAAAQPAAQPAPSTTRAQVVRPDVPAWTKVLSWVLLVLVVAVLLAGWGGSLVALRRAPG